MNADIIALAALVANVNAVLAAAGLASIVWTASTERDYSLVCQTRTMSYEQMSPAAKALEAAGLKIAVTEGLGYETFRIWVA